MLHSLWNPPRLPSPHFLPNMLKSCCCFFGGGGENSPYVTLNLDLHTKHKVPHSHYSFFTGLCVFSGGKILSQKSAVQKMKVNNKGWGEADRFQKRGANSLSSPGLWHTRAFWTLLASFWLPQPRLFTIEGMIQGFQSLSHTFPPLVLSHFCLPPTYFFCSSKVSGGSPDFWGEAGWDTPRAKAGLLPKKVLVAEL